jgi:hypothetical protein
MVNLVHLLVLLASTFQTSSTHCQTVDVRIGSLAVDKQLVGCGVQYFDNVLWNLDRADGTVDGTYVAGIAARMLEANPTLTPVQLEQRIKASPSFVGDPFPPAGGDVAVLIESPPPPTSRHRIVGY